MKRRDKKSGNNLKPQNVGARAFKHGTQGVDIAELEAEIAAEFEQRRQTHISESTGPIHELEANALIAAERKVEADKRWQMIDDLHEGRRIDVVKPAIAAFAAGTLILAEGVLLAPAMDGLNIPEFWAQVLVATVMVAALSGLLDIAIHNFQKIPRKMWLVVSTAGFALISLFVFGLWRAEEVIFAGTVNGENGFAADNAMLTRVMLVLITVALPVTAAFLLDFAFRKLRLWLERRKAKADFLRFSREAEEAEKALQAAREKLEADLDAISQTKESWIRSVHDNFEKGRRIGAWKLPFWQAVILPTIVTSLLVFVILFLPAAVAGLSGIIVLDIFGLTLFAMLWLGITGLFAMHFIRKWNRPTDDELFDQLIATHWQNTADPNSLRLIEADRRRLEAHSVGKERLGLKPAVNGFDAVSESLGGLEK